MIKRVMLALTFTATLAIGSLGVTSKAEARHRHHHHNHCDGGWYGRPVPHYRSHFRAYGPRYSTHYHRFGGYPDPYLYGPRSGVSFYYGF
jgi:hypothetical protein